MTRDHFILKRGMYYRPNRAGYTVSLLDAGLYTKEEAEAEAAIEPSTMMAVPVASRMSEIDDMLALHQAAIERIEQVRHSYLESMEQANG